MKLISKLFFLVFALALIVIPARAQGYDPTWQSPVLWSNEAQIVYLGNLEREKVGLPPLRWNKQLTYAARWFSWDSLTNQPYGYIGHQDSNGEYPGERAAHYGYQGNAGAENAFWSSNLLKPAEAIKGWMQSSGHRKNILNPYVYEIGVGYHETGDSYVVQHFGYDPVYAPVVINNEAPETTSPLVNLYVYDGKSDGWDGAGSAQEMQVSNDMCFLGADWQPYQPNVQWTLPAGDPGWRTVYVRTRDANHRVRSASDAIYYGTPLAEARTDEVQFSSTEEQVTLLGLDGSGLPLMQFSLGWQADDSLNEFHLWWGEGQRVEDRDAWGGTAYRLENNGTYAWVNTTNFMKDIPLVAYVRLKVNNNNSTDGVIDVSVTGGEHRTIQGTDFEQAGVYQEFAMPFIFGEDETWLTIDFNTLSGEDVYVDTVTFFTEPIPVQETYTWDVPGGNYRGQGVWVRYVNESLDTFSEIQDGAQFGPRVAVMPDTLHTVAMLEMGDYIWQLKVVQGCSAAPWNESTDAAWLNLVREGDYLRITVSPETLGLGSHKAVITITPTDDSIAPVQVPIEVEVVEYKLQTFFPVLLR